MDSSLSVIPPARRLLFRYISLGSFHKGPGDGDNIVLGVGAVTVCDDGDGEPGIRLEIDIGGQAVIPSLMAVPGAAGHIFLPVHAQAVGAFRCDGGIGDQVLRLHHQLHGFGLEDTHAVQFATHLQHGNDAVEAVGTDPERAGGDVGMGPGITAIGVFIYPGNGFAGCQHGAAFLAEPVGHVARIRQHAGVIGGIDAKGKKDMFLHVGMHALAAEGFDHGTDEAAVEIGIAVLGTGGDLFGKITVIRLQGFPIGEVVLGLIEAGGVAEHLPDGDGLIRESRVYHLEAHNVFYRGIQADAFFFNQLHQPHGADQLGHRGDAEAGVQGDGLIFAGIFIAVSRTEQNFAIPGNNDGTAHNFPSPETGMGIFFRQFRQAKGRQQCKQQHNRYQSFHGITCFFLVPDIVAWKTLPHKGKRELLHV